jgi:Protein of unknown function (DUF2971)
MMNILNKLNELGTLFKYISDSSKVIDGIFKNHKIRFTQPAALNDPLEFNPAIRFNSENNSYKSFRCNGVYFPSMNEWSRFELIEPRINRYGILSLTDNPYSFEMWSHYANGHKGFLLELKVSSKIKPALQLEEGLSLRAHNVKYVTDYTVNLDRLSQGRNKIPFYKIRDAIFLKKIKNWKYEREYRIIRQLDECETYQPPPERKSYRDKKGVYLFPLSMNCISSVIFGVHTSKEIKREIIELCKNTSIVFMQTVIYNDIGKINFLPVEHFGTIENYLSLLPQVFTCDSIEENHRKPIIVSSLDKIPYVNSQRNDWESYYKKKMDT